MPTINPTTEVLTEKNKPAYAPVLLANFTGLSYRLASKSYTVNDGGSVAYSNEISAKGAGTLKQNITEKIFDLSSVPVFRLTVSDFRGSTRASLFSASPDISGEAVDIYLKFDTGSNDFADALLIFSGFVKDWDESENSITINLETQHFADLPQVPATTLFEDDTESQAAAGIGAPLQYGDFSFDENIIFFADSEEALARIPYIKTANEKYHFSIAGHEMQSLPSATEIDHINANPYLFTRRNRSFIALKPASAETTINNSGSGASLAIEHFPDAYYYFWPQAIYEGGVLAKDAENAIDGSAATSATVQANTSSKVFVHDFQPNIENVDLSANTSYAFYVYITGITGNNEIELKRKSDGATVAGSLFTLNGSTPLNQWVEWYADNFSLDDLSGYYIEVSGTIAGTGVDVAGIVGRLKVTDYDPASDEKGLYMRCKGREFSGTWSARRTPGDLITNAADMLESIFRDEFSITDIDTTKFDELKSLTPLHIVNASIYRQRSGKSLLASIAASFGYGISLLPGGTASVVIPLNTVNFKNGITGPAAEDIFSDNDVLAGGSYSQLTMRKNTFALKSTDSRNLQQKTTVFYRPDFSDNPTKSTSSGSGTNRSKENLYIARQAAAADIASNINTWLSRANLIASFSTNLIALGQYLGTVANIRHDDISASLINSDETTERWLCISYELNFFDDEIKLVYANIPSEESGGGGGS